MNAPIPERPVALRLSALDEHLLNQAARTDLSGFRRFAFEFLYFGIKEARACLFVALFFAAVFTVPRAGVLGVPRYDVLLILAIAIQAWMVWAKLETLDELKAITLFHVVGFALEVFKTSGGIQSWSYPDFAYTSCSACRCSPASCTPQSAATSSRPGACSSCASSTTRLTGWPA